MPDFGVARPVLHQPLHCLGLRFFWLVNALGNVDLTLLGVENYLESDYYYVAVLESPVKCVFLPGHHVQK